MTTPRRPNILVFMTDQQQGAVTDAGHPCRMPNLQRFAQEGVRFSRAYTPAAHCCPARASFWTGQSPSRHRIFNDAYATPTALGMSLAPDTRLFTDGLREDGYSLTFSGKWHASADRDPDSFGFKVLKARNVAGWKDWMPWDEWPRHEDIGRRGAEFWHRWPLAAALDPIPPRGWIGHEGWGNERLYGTNEEGDFDREVTHPLIEALPGLAASGEPWFAFVGTFAPHDPYDAPERFVSQYDPATVPLPASYGDPMTDKPGIYRRLARDIWGQLGETGTREAIAHYWAANTMVDELFGEVLAALEATGQAENTIVVFTSDHGDFAGAHGLFYKGAPAFEEAYRIPLLVRWPAGIANPGRTVDALVSLLDLGPTLTELAGLPSDPAHEGRSLAPFLRNEPRPDAWRTEICTQFQGGTEILYTQRAVITRRWKYVFNGFDFDELYDLEADPAELINRAEDPACEPVKRDLVRRLWRHAIATGDEMVSNPYPPLKLVPYGPLVELLDETEVRTTPA